MLDPLHWSCSIALRSKNTWGKNTKSNEKKEEYQAVMRL